MASITKSNDENAAKAEPPDDSDVREGGKEIRPAKTGKGGGGKEPPTTVEYARATTPGGRGGGFFTIHKSGQGYWTRMGTLIAVGLLGLALAYTLYSQIPPFYQENPTLGRKVGVGVAGGFLLVYTLIALRVMNKPGNVDFLIATDSEMKKVNWTSRKELIGSTKVVVIFMFLIAAILFVVDQIFHLLFFLIDVLKTPPFWWPHK